MTKIIYTAALASVLVLSLMTSNGLSGTNLTASASAFNHDDDHHHPILNGDHDHGNHNICPSQSFLVGPSGHGNSKILDVTYTILNDEDSGFTGYWGLDHITEHLTVWKLADGSFYALKTYDGIFVAPTGGLSPGAGLPQVESAFGDMTGGYVATFTADTFSPTLPTSGNIVVPHNNFGGTMTDVLKGSYGNGQTGDSGTEFDWLGAYFTSTTGFADFAQPHWGWSYTLDKELQSNTSVNQWCNYNTSDGGSSGDILTQ